MAKKRKRKSGDNRTSVERFVKFGVIAVLATIVAFEAGSFSLITSLQKVSPETVQTVANDPLSALSIAQNVKFTKPDEKLGPETAAYARQALIEDPLRTLPIRMLALRSLDAGSPAAATILNLLSQKVSRRDLYTQIQLIGYAADQKDVRQVLVHYDRALRVHPEAGVVLFPLLANALAEKSAMQYMSEFVREPAPWFDEFARSVVQARGPGLFNLARLLIHVGPSDATEVPPSFVPEMIENLIGDGQTPLARQFLIASMNAPEANFRDPSITGKTTDPSLGTFGWTANSGGGISATIEGISTKGADAAAAIRIFANPNERKFVLRRVFSLHPGTYQYSEKRDVVNQDPSSKSQWILSCLTNAGTQLIWRASARLRSDEFTIPNSGCNFQMLELDVNGGDGEAGIEFVITDFELQKK